MQIWRSNSKLEWIGRLHRHDPNRDRCFLDKPRACLIAVLTFFGVITILSSARAQVINIDQNIKEDINIVAIVSATKGFVDYTIVREQFSGFVLNDDIFNNMIINHNIKLSSIIVPGSLNHPLLLSAFFNEGKSINEARSEMKYHGVFSSIKDVIDSARIVFLLSDRSFNLAGSLDRSATVFKGGLNDILAGLVVNGYSVQKYSKSRLYGPNDHIHKNTSRKTQVILSKGNNINNVKKEMRSLEVLPWCHTNSHNLDEKIYVYSSAYSDAWTNIESWESAQLVQNTVFQEHLRRAMTLVKICTASVVAAQLGFAEKGTEIYRPVLPETEADMQKLQRLFMESFKNRERN